MGEIIKLKCKNNDYEKNLQAGNGIMYATPEGIRSLFEDCQADEMNELKKDGYSFSARRRICFDAEAKEYFSVVYCEMRKEDLVKKFIGRLPEGCTEVKVEELQDPYEGCFICPICNKKLTVTREGFWD